MSDPARMHWDHPDFYVKSRDEMMKLFGELERPSIARSKNRAAMRSQAGKKSAAVPEFDDPARA